MVRCIMSMWTKNKCEPPPEEVETEANRILGLITPESPQKWSRATIKCGDILRMVDAIAACTAPLRLCGICEDIIFKIIQDGFPDYDVNQYVPTLTLAFHLTIIITITGATYGGEWKG